MEGDTFRLLSRCQRRSLMGQIIERGLHCSPVQERIENYCRGHGIEDSEKFTAMILTDLKDLHANAQTGQGITMEQFEAWQRSKP